MRLSFTAAAFAAALMTGAVAPIAQADDVCNGIGAANVQVAQLKLRKEAPRSRFRRPGVAPRGMRGFAAPLPASADGASGGPKAEKDKIKIPDNPEVLCCEIGGCGCN